MKSKKGVASGKGTDGTNMATQNPEPKTQNLKEVLIYCDGSSLGNGRGDPRAAAVALLGFRGVWRAFGEYLGGATNQQAEVAAAALGLEQLREPCRVTVLSDSRYVVETMSGRFRRKSNHEWWARLDKAADAAQDQMAVAQGARRPRRAGGRGQGRPQDRRRRPRRRNRAERRRRVGGRKL